MIKEAIAYIEDLVKRSSAPELLLQSPWRRDYLVGGQHIPLDVPPGPREHTAGSLEEIIALANRFEQDSECEPVVWYNEHDVTLVFDDNASRAETATLTLEPSDIFARLIQLRKLKLWIEQKDFIRLLRIDLAGTMPPAVLLDRVRKLKIENGQTVHQEVAKQRESMGRALTATVTGEGEIPEVVSVSAPVYKTFGEDWRFSVNCSVEVDPTRIDAFRIMPLPDEIERVGYLALQSIRERLSEGLAAGIPSYYGSP